MTVSDSKYNLVNMFTIEYLFIFISATTTGTR